MDFEVSTIRITDQKLSDFCFVGIGRNKQISLWQSDLDVGTWPVVDLDNIGLRVVDLDIFSDLSDVVWSG